MDIHQLPPSSSPVSRLHDQVPPTRRVAQVARVSPGREPWDEAIFLRSYNSFASQLSRPAFDGSSAKLSELAFVYERSSATTLEAFAGQVLTTHPA